MPTLHVLRGADKGQTFHTPAEPAILGRLSAHIPLTDHSVSRRHAEIRPENGHWVLFDLSSSNGTYLNGVRMNKPARLQEGDQIKLGGTLLVFSGEEAPGAFPELVPPSDQVEIGTNSGNMDSSILAALSSSEDSLILAAPETADAVHAWTIIYKIAEATGTSATVDELLERVADIISDRVELDRIFLLMKDKDSGEYRTRVVRRRSRKRESSQEKITASRTIIKHVLDTREGVLCANAMSDHRFGDVAKEGSIARLGLRSVICVPIVAHDEVHGVIHMDCSMSHHTYTNEQLRLATAIGRLTGMAIENVHLLESRMANERLAAVGETVAHLSHYIRNVLQGISSGAEVVDLGLKKESIENIRTGWNIVQRNLDRTYQLTTNMLTFSKQRKAAIELGSLNRAIEDALAILQRRADEKGVMLLADLDDALPSVPMDYDGMVQVVLNVVGNAIDAAPKDHGRVTLHSSYNAANDDVCLAIRDNGPGIPAEELEHIFDAFHSTKGHGGTGLGLAAAKKIVRELGGRISVRSKVGEGTQFLVQLSVRTIELTDSEKTHGHAG